MGGFGMFLTQSALNAGPLIAAQPGLTGGHHHEPVLEDRLGRQRHARVLRCGRRDGHVCEPVGDQDAHLLGHRDAGRHLDRAGEACTG